MLDAGAHAVDFAYDSLSRLTVETYLHAVDPSPCDGDPPPLIDENGNTCSYQTEWIQDSSRVYAYDAVGNRTDQSGSYATGNRITGFAGCTYTTDYDGNVTSRACAGQTVTFGWSAESRLVWMKVGSDSVAFAYDAAGRLARRTKNGAVQSYFWWEGDDLLAELNAAGTSKIAEYSYFGMDKPHALIVRDTVFYAHTDGIGNVIALTDSAQAVRRTYVYDAWGQPQGGSDLGSFNGADRARFKGALWFGQETELYYMRNRWYEVKTGRFLSEDPLGLSGGTNAYVYAAADPVNLKDPRGTCPQGMDLLLTIHDDGTWEAECVLGRLPPPAGGNMRGANYTAMFGMPDARPRGWLSSGSSTQDPLEGHTFFVKSASLVACPVRASFSQHWMRTLWWGGDARYVEGEVDIRRATVPSSRVAGWAWYGGHVRAVQTLPGGGTAVLFDGLVLGEISCRSGAGTLTGFRLAIHP